MAHYLDLYPGPEIKINNKQYLYFGGTAYLGLQSDPVFQARLFQNIKKYGTNYGASRNSNIRLSVFEAAEKSLALQAGAESCLSLSSGYLAGQLLSSYFHAKGHQGYYAPNSHSALHQFRTTPFESYDLLKEAVIECINTTSKSPVVYLDTLDSEEACYPHFEALKSFPLQDIILVADDSHGFGVLGQQGCGAYSALKNLNPKELFLCCSLGKAMGIQGGAVMGRGKILAELRNTDFFGGASPAAPAALATLMESATLLQEKQDKVKAYIEYFEQEVKESSIFHSIPGHPVFTFSENSLVVSLEKKGIVITNFNYPTADTPTTSRIVLTAAHSEAHIKALAQAINQYLQR